MFVFQKILRALFYCNTRFDIRPFALLPTKYLEGLSKSIATKCRELEKILECDNLAI